jgi:hypothetical protein
MLGSRQEAQSTLFFDISLADHVPAAHILRAVDGIIDLYGVERIWRSALKLVLQVVRDTLQMRVSLQPMPTSSNQRQRLIGTLRQSMQMKRHARSESTWTRWRMRLLVRPAQLWPSSSRISILHHNASRDIATQYPAGNRLGHVAGRSPLSLGLIA